MFKKFFQIGLVPVARPILAKYFFYITRTNCPRYILHDYLYKFSFLITKLITIFNSSLFCPGLQIKTEDPSCIEFMACSNVLCSNGAGSNALYLTNSTTCWRGPSCHESTNWQCGNCEDWRRLKKIVNVNCEYCLKQKQFGKC